MGTHGYRVVYEQGTENWSAYAPRLPGCVATGKDRAETRNNIEQAIELHLAGMREDGLELPPPRGRQIGARSARARDLPRVQAG